jgi:hypothetical protein
MPRIKPQRCDDPPNPRNTKDVQRVVTVLKAMQENGFGVLTFLEAFFTQALCTDSSLDITLAKSRDRFFKGPYHKELKPTRIFDLVYNNWDSWYKGRRDDELIEKAGGLLHLQIETWATGVVKSTISREVTALLDSNVIGLAVPRDQFLTWSTLLSFSLETVRTSFESMAPCTWTTLCAIANTEPGASGESGKRDRVIVSTNELHANCYRTYLV